MPSEFSGIWPAMLTPITPSGEVNLSAIDQLVDLFVRQRLDGLYITGSTGQWPVLGRERRMQVVERTLRAAAGRIPVMVHVGALSTAESVELARHAASAGADAISSVAPGYYAYNADAIFEHYRHIGLASDLPLYIYHFSNVQQASIPPEDYVARLLKLPQIAGMKFTDLNIYQLGLLQSASQGRLRFFSGADELLLPAVLCGAAGAVGTFYNLWGPTCKAERDSLLGGNVSRAADFTLRFQSVLSQILRRGGVYKFLHSAMRIQHGIDVGKPIPPLATGEGDWQDDEVKRLIAMVEGPAAVA